MAVQIRNTIFDASVVARRNELAALLTASVPITAVKKTPVLRSSSPKYTYEIVTGNIVLHLEIAGDTDPADIAALDAVITASVPLITQANGWEVGTDTDLRAG